MGKGVAFIVVFCAITIAVFGGMVYLMKDINPPPLNPEDLKDDLNFYDRKLEPIIFDVDSPIDRELYGFKNNDTTIQESSSTDVTIRFITVENVSNTWKYTTQKVKNDAMWLITPTAPIKNLSKTIETGDITSYLTSFNQTDITNIFSLDNPEYAHVKGHRRSINDLKRLGDNTNPGSVILKIIDDSGQSRIEIKLSSNDSFKRKKIRENTNLNKKKSRFNMTLQSNNTDELISSELAMDTIITIMSNDSVIIDEYDDHWNDENKIGNNWKEDKKDYIKNENNSDVFNMENSTVHSTIDNDKMLVRKHEQTINKTMEQSIYQEKNSVLLDNEPKFINIINSSSLKEVKTPNNISDKHITNLYTYIVTRSTDYKDSSTIMTENSTTLSEYSMPQTLSADHKNFTMEMLNSDFAVENSLVATKINIVLENSTLAMQKMAPNENTTTEIDNTTVEENSTVKKDGLIIEIVSSYVDTEIFTTQTESLTAETSKNTVEIEIGIVGTESNLIEMESNTVETESATIETISETVQIQNSKSYT